MTESAASSSLEIDYYLERVAAALADLPPEVRDDLLEDLPAHFAEVLEEQGGTLVDRLGPPVAYAAELRAAAGLETPATTRPSLPGRLDGIVRRVRKGAGVADRKVGRLIGYPRAADFLRLLRPAWWVARAVFIVVLIFAADIIPADRFDDPLGWLVLAVAVVVSVRIGATGRPRAPKWPGYAVTAVAVVGALFVVANSDGILYRFTNTFRYQSNEPYDRWSHVTDVFPVDENGRPLQNVTLYDQDGNPITLGDYWRCQNNDPHDGTDPRPAPSYPLCKGPRLATPPPTATTAPSATPSLSPPLSPTP
ncbi:hypothetical protein Drose_33505 [Dactylosporangium roseum]|uniref:Uncharacterized protein n=1 Tax=Dactylosporangium roseum TaxID=47989 RepID=A0ABY5Z1N9_9ACTN|nr:hypothetical protein [Dactylosporangium roseum]UWZ35949.1 hypothetical protein Drose_33505 [Dactylosporangium roseum]